MTVTNTDAGPLRTVNMSDLASFEMKAPDLMQRGKPNPPPEGVRIDPAQVAEHVKYETVGPDGWLLVPRLDRCAWCHEAAGVDVIEFYALRPEGDLYRLEYPGRMAGARFHVTLVCHADCGLDFTYWYGIDRLADEDPRHLFRHLTETKPWCPPTLASDLYDILLMHRPSAAQTLGLRW